jgi:hypothetical protein
MQQQPVLLATAVTANNAKIARLMIVCNPFSLYGIQPAA